MYEALYLQLMSSFLARRGGVSQLARSHGPITQFQGCDMHSVLLQRFPWRINMVPTIRVFIVLCNREETKQAVMR